MPRAPKKCAHPTCENRVVAKTWCAEHNVRWPARTGRAVPVRLQRACFERDDYQCRGCGYAGRPGDGTLHADHIRPRAAGGPDALDNLATLCRRCHHAKSQREAAAARG